MRFGALRSPNLLRWICLALGLAAAAAAAAAAEPARASTEALAFAGSDEALVWVRRMIDRARVVGADTNLPLARFDKLSVYETLGTDGMVKKSREKRYEVLVRQGMTHNRLVSLDGRKLSEEESAVQSEKEKKWRDTYSANRSGGSADRMDQIVNERLFARFVFGDGGRERVRGRECAVLTLSPRADGGPPEERLMDRVINLMHGRIWVDTADHEIVRAEVETKGELRLWGGVLGSLEAFRMHVDREPGEGGIWYNRHLEVVVRGRKLFSSLWMRAREIGSGLRLVERSPGGM